MPNIATVLKEEISRIARKEVRAETASLKGASTSHRSDLAELKRRMQALEGELGRLRKALAKTAPPAPVEAEPDAAAVRFSAKGFASHRERLELSAEACAKLVGVSGQTVYNWESGAKKPRAALLPAITAFRAMGKRQAAARLAALTQEGAA